ncbi:MAG TPA: hypothetical protein PLW93_00365 [Candidatus Absconditabacterales bacterium]|nr:hypothetical protein [Candidatus Absconditabacterales bacterium]
MNYKKQKAIDAKQKRIADAKEKMKTIEKKDYGYYNVITGRGYSIKNQCFLASQGVPFGGVIAFSEVYKRNDSLKKKERVWDIRKGCKTASVMLYQKASIEKNENGELIEKKGFLKMGSVLSVSDLLLEGERVDENYAGFTARLDSESDIEASEDDIIKFLETME